MLPRHTSYGLRSLRWSCFFLKRIPRLANLLKGLTTFTATVVKRNQLCVFLESPFRDTESRLTTCADFVGVAMPLEVADLTRGPHASEYPHVKTGDPLLTYTVATPTVL